MPKKHRPKFLNSSSSTFSHAPSSSSLTSNIPAVTGSKDHTSVNDLLAHLRISQPQTDVPRAPVSITRSVPPSLQQLLVNAEPPPPLRPRVQIGVPRRNRIPGPPPPASWLAATTTEGEHQEEEEATFKIKHGEKDVHRLPDLAHIGPHRLAHTALVAIAREWSFHIVYNQHYLYTLRSGLKSALLAYIATYSPNGVGVDGLRVLFKDGADDDERGGEGGGGGGEWEAEADFSGNEDVRHMDLTRGLGPGLTWKDLSGLFQPSPPPVEKVISRPAHPENFTQEAWGFNSIPSRNRFPSLTHISLSYPHPTMSSWTRLTSFTHLIPTVTHLSLSGWPLPSSIDPAGVLKRFARGLLCLKWLDVSDCNVAFYEALMEVEWDRCWRGVETIVCKQARETPKLVKDERAKAAGELKKCIKVIRQEMGGKWCRVVV